MLVKPTLLLLAVSTALGFVLPADLADGVYSVEYDAATGEALSAPSLVGALEARTPVRAPPPSRIVAARAPPPLESPRTLCSATGNLRSRPDFDTVKAQFNGICEKDTMYPKNVAMVVSYGSALAYMCNFDKSTNRCWREEYEEASTLMDRTCGTAVAARVYIARWDKTYGRDNQGANICATVP